MTSSGYETLKSKKKEGCELVYKWGDAEVSGTNKPAVLLIEMWWLAMEVSGIQWGFFPWYTLKKNTLGTETKTILIQLVHNTMPEKVLITTDARLKPPQG